MTTKKTKNLKLQKSLTLREFFSSDIGKINVMYCSFHNIALFLTLKKVFFQ